MQYISTRGQTPPRDFVQVMLEGLAPDGGLYVPALWPTLAKDKIAKLHRFEYVEVACRIIAIAMLVACNTFDRPSGGPALLTEHTQLDQHVGEVVTIRGIVTNTKVATIIGVDVQSNNPDLRGQNAEATGLLQRWRVTQAQLDAMDARYGPVQHRGPGIRYRLKAIDSNCEAPVRPIARHD